MNFKFPVKYVNGNYQVTIENDGTKTRFTPESLFVPKRPETIDLNISNYCTNNCPWCYINASPEGKHGNLDHPLFKTIPPFTELAVNYADHPGLRDFLERMKNQKVITNMTVNQNDFNKLWAVFMNWQTLGLIHGIGISINSHVLIPKIKYFKNTVAHTIFGITTFDDYRWISKNFEKVLVLGYKDKGRGKNIVPKAQFDVRRLFDIFKVVSFDNLGICQAINKADLPEEVWNTNFMGDEGFVSFYIDSVNLKFFKSSLEVEGADVKNKTVIEMFNEVKKWQ